MADLASWDRFRERIAAGLRRPVRDPLIPIAVAAVAGILLGDRFPIQPSWFAGATLLSLILCITRRFPGRFVLAACIAFAFAQSVATWSIRQFPFSPNLRDGESIRIRAEGIVATRPTRLGSGDVRRCLIEIWEISVAGGTWTCRHRLPVTLTDPPTGLDYGQRLRFSGLLQPLDIQRSPGAFAPDRFYYRSAGATGEIVIHGGDAVEVIASGAGSPLIDMALRSRTWIENAITRGLENDPETASVIKAMVLGAREDTPEHIEEQFRLSGAMHVFAVSGLHVGIFGAILWWILRGLRVPRRWAILVLIPAILFYAVVTGLRPSAVRAAVMGTIVLAAFVAERRPRLLNSLAFAGLLILALDPQQLFLPGFQLSFAVLASIALFADPLARGFRRPFRLDPLIPRQFIPRWRRGLDQFQEKVATGLGVSIAAWAGSALLIIHYFQIVTPIAVVANLLLVPLAFCVLGTATISALLSLTGLGPLSSILNLANATFAQVTTFTAATFASVPGGYLHISPATAFASPPDCRVTVLEPGPGGVTSLISVYPARFQSIHWLIDPGNPAGFASRVQPLLRHYGINQLQLMALTHGDSRHSGAAGMALQRFPTGVLMKSSLAGQTRTHRDLEDSLARTRTREVIVDRGDRIRLGPEALIEVLYPDRRSPPSQSGADNRCLVLRLTFHDWKILFTSDSGFLTAKWFEERGTDLKADVWVKGWHSSDHQGFLEFVEPIQPRVIVTTQRSFPAGQQITAAQQIFLEENGITVFDLAEAGAVTLDFSTEALKLTPFVTGEAVTLDQNRLP